MTRSRGIGLAVYECVLRFILGLHFFVRWYANKLIGLAYLNGIFDSVKFMVVFLPNLVSVKIRSYSLCTNQMFKSKPRPMGNIPRIQMKSSL